MSNISRARVTSTRGMMRLRVWVPLLLASVLSGCSDTLAGPELAPNTPANVVVLNCQGSAKGVSCTPDVPGGANGYVIFGGYGSLIKLAGRSSSVVYDNTTGVLTEVVDVQNLLGQPLGTGSDWVTPDTGGVKVFFHVAPNNGVTINNADGIGTFTGSNQTFYKYSEIVSGNAVNQVAKTWSFTLPNPATPPSFTFQVYIYTGLPDESAGASGNIPAHSFASVGTGEGDFGQHVCGIRAGGSVYCWGSGQNGEFGIGSVTQGSPYLLSYPSPVQALSPLSFTQVTAGDGHTCAVTTSGSARCWGVGNNGQLGNAATSNSALPVAVASLSSISLITAGTNHTCAINSGAAYCWGRGDNGQIGDGSSGTPTKISSPSPVTGLTSGVTVLSAGDRFTCAVVNGAAKCWGDRTTTAIGDGGSTTGNQTTPVGMFGLSSGVTDIATGGFAGNGFGMACAVVGGGVKCWGSNNNGGVGTPLLGNGSSYSATPVDVTGLTAGSGVTQVSVGRFHACALLGASGVVKCWGRGTEGQIGNGSTANQAGAVTATVSSVDRIMASQNATCAHITNNTIKCWGSNLVGMLGDGSAVNNTARSTPVTVLNP